jgi:hypothetical protein
MPSYFTLPRKSPSQGHNGHISSDGTEAKSICGLLLATGIFFGLYPATRAAALSPIGVYSTNRRGEAFTRASEHGGKSGTRKSRKSAKTAMSRLSFAPFVAFRGFRGPNAFDCARLIATLARRPVRGGYNGSNDGRSRKPKMS